ncbi:MAG: hypothetical protein ACYTF6_14555 [Planctomycetota bacterium]|jgi:hypothetical protein
MAEVEPTPPANHATTVARKSTHVGLDWETELRQRPKEVALKELGLFSAHVIPSSTFDQVDETKA